VLGRDLGEMLGESPGLELELALCSPSRISRFWWCAVDEGREKDEATTSR